MKILFIQKKTGPGGSKESLLQTIRILTAAGNRVRVLCSEPGYLTEQLEQHEIPFSEAYVPEYRKLPDRLRFRRHMARIDAGLPERDFDWIISNEMWWAPVAADLATRTGSRSAAILRDTLTGAAKLSKYDLHRLDRVLCINPAMICWVNQLPRAKGLAHNILNPVTLPEADRAACELWKEIIDSWPGVGRTFLMVGSLGRRKNQSDAVRTLHCLPEKFSDTGVIFAGGGKEYAAEIRKTAARLSMTGKILVPGHVNDVHGLLKAVNYFIFTSTREGLPRSIIEALLAGVPAFSYPLPGLENIYGEFCEKFVAEMPEPQSLGKTIENALAEGNLDSAVATLRARLKDEFSEAQHLKRLHAILR